MANWNRRSRVSQNRNKRQSFRRGGAPPRASSSAPKAPVPREDGSLCLAIKTEKDCVGTPVMRKTCQWHKEYSDAKGKQHSARCQGKAAKHLISEEGRSRLDKFESQRKQAVHDAFYSSEDCERAPLPRASPQSKRNVSKKAAAPAQLRRAQAKASGEKYVPVMSRNAPMGCVQKQYNQVSAKGKSFVTSRCVDSKDPKVNDLVNCSVNRETNKCKKK